MNLESPVLLTVRGTLVPKSLDAARTLHNETAGSQQGIAAARALGDLSHKVYAPVVKAGGTEDGELLFLDYWVSPQGIGQFFSNAHVQEQGSKLFSKRDPVVWMPAKGAFAFNLPAAQGRNDRWLGIVRGVVKSPEAAIEAFKKALSPSIVDARKRGQLSHEIYFRLPMPGENLPPEMIGIDVWCDAAGMQEHYKDLKGLDAAFAGRPATSVWEQANGGWSEW
ncbi:MAG TPA: hypothetical protein VGH28_13305 [Polyangiaceae bacterium]